MKLIAVADAIDGLDQNEDSTVALCAAALRSGHEAWWADVAHLSAAGAGVRALARPLVAQGDRTLAAEDAVNVSISDFDAVLIRHDPPVDAAYRAKLHVLALAEGSGPVFVNSPSGLLRANEKTYANALTDIVPASLVTSKAAALEEFVVAHRRAVIKPLFGHAGRGVALAVAGDRNLRCVLELLTARDHRDVIAQAWVDAVEDGNRRVVVFDGEVVGAVNRVPMDGDFRTGPPTIAISPDAADRRIAARVAPLLRQDGLLLAGLDVAGDKLLEVNVTSPGGLVHIERLGGVAVCDRIIARLEYLLPQVLKEHVNA